MRVIVIKNNSAVTKTWCNKDYTAGEEAMLSTEAQADEYFGNATFVAALAAGDAKVGNGNILMPSIAEALSWLSGDTVDVATTPPFAEPLYRTKLDAVAAGVTVQPNSQGNLDFTMPAERYVYGGEGVVVGAEPGDWIEAMVYDADSVIPEQYRAALCEASPGWPVVNTYCIKQWILAPGGGLNAIFRINTEPLIAKVTAGLVLRTVYHAANVGNARTVYGNLFMTIKL